MQFIKNYFFIRLYHLEKLILGSNSISSIEKKSFYDLVYLTDLDLSENCLFQIDQELFKHTLNMISMNFSYNVIKKFDSKTFSSLKRLTKFSLANNLIEHFSIGQFSNLASLDLSFNPLLKDVTLTNKFVRVYLNGNRMMNIIQPNNNLSNLRYLYLSQVRNKLFESVKFNLMPNLFELDLSSNQVINLTYLEKYDNTKLKCLWLRNMNISFESSLFVRFPNLEVLDVGGCKQMKFTQNNEHISNLIKLNKLSLNNLNVNFDLKFIAHLVDLEYLDVSNNQIETIFIPNLFERLKANRLKYLNLSYNKLKEFDPSYLFVKPQDFFEVLDLSFNSISSMNLNFLRGSYSTIKVVKVNNNYLTQVDFQYLILSSEIVDFSFNRLNSFHKDIEYYANMKYLKLNGNVFEFLTDQLFRSIDLYTSQLVLLDLSRNKVKNISETSLLDLFNLKYLKLGQNQLIKIENRTFLNLIKLIELDLSNNHLMNLDQSLLKSSPFLLKLNLSSNKLKFLDKELFWNLKELVSLDLSYNSIKSFSFLNVGLAKLTDLNIQFNLLTTFEQLNELDSMANFYISSDVLNTFESISNLVKSFYKKKPIRRRLISRRNDSIEYFKSVNIFFPNNQNNSVFFKTDRDCFNVLYLIKLRIILNLRDIEQLELLMAECKSYIHKLFVN